jgi:nucleoside-diphosphate-sugar epimerase
MAKILITGAAGFIGYHLWEKLCRIHKITGIDNLTDFSNEDMKYLRLSELFGCKIDCNNSTFISNEKGDFSQKDILDQDYDQFYSLRANLI